MKVSYEREGAAVSGLLVLQGSTTSLRVKFEADETDESLPARCVGLETTQGKTLELTPASKGGIACIEGRVLPFELRPVIEYANGQRARLAPLYVVPLWSQRLALILAIIALLQVLMGVWLLNSISWEEDVTRIWTSLGSLAALTGPTYLALSRFAGLGRGRLEERFFTSFLWPLGANVALLLFFVVARALVTRVENSTGANVPFSSPNKTLAANSHQLWPTRSVLPAASSFACEVSGKSKECARHFETTASLLDLLLVPRAVVLGCPAGRDAGCCFESEGGHELEHVQYTWALAESGRCRKELLAPGRTQGLQKVSVTGDAGLSGSLALREPPFPFTSYRASFLLTSPAGTATTSPVTIELPHTGALNAQYVRFDVASLGRPLGVLDCSIAAGSEISIAKSEGSGIARAIMYAQKKRPDDPLQPSSDWTISSPELPNPIVYCGASSRGPAHAKLWITADAHQRDWSFPLEGLSSPLQLDVVQGQTQLGTVTCQWGGPSAPVFLRARLHGLSADTNIEVVHPAGTGSEPRQPGASWIVSRWNGIVASQTAWGCFPASGLSSASITSEGRPLTLGQPVPAARHSPLVIKPGLEPKPCTYLTATGEWRSARCRSKDNCKTLRVSDELPSYCSPQGTRQCDLTERECL